MKLRFSGWVLAASFAAPAAAQGWDWSFTPYLWAAAIDGDIALGSVGSDVDVEFSELVDVLAGTALLHVETASDDHVVFGDLVWLKVEPEDEISTSGGAAETELDTTIFEVGYARRREPFGFEVGLRYWDFEVQIDPALLAAVERSTSWIDGFGGFRHTRDFGRSWVVTTRANIGTGGADLTVGFQLDFARELASGNAFVAGFRLLDIDYEEDSVGGIPFVLDATFFGATVGYRFD